MVQAALVFLTMRVRYLIYVQNENKNTKRKKEKNPPKIILPAVYTITSSPLPNSLYHQVLAY